jgi:hypothetical protein
VQKGDCSRFGLSTFAKIVAATVLLVLAVFLGTALNGIGENYRQGSVAIEERKPSLDLQPAVLGVEVQRMLKADAARNRERARAKRLLTSDNPSPAERTSLSGAE